jgi:hypothetical protein
MSGDNDIVADRRVKDERLLNQERGLLIRLGYMFAAFQVPVADEETYAEIGAADRLKESVFHSGKAGYNRAWPPIKELRSFSHHTPLWHMKSQSFVKCLTLVGEAGLPHLWRASVLKLGMVLHLTTGQYLAVIQVTPYMARVMVLDHLEMSVTASGDDTSSWYAPVGSPKTVTCLC